MSSPVAKGVRRTASRQSSAKSPAKTRTLKSKSARPKPISKRSAGTKAPARKATKLAAGSVKTAAKKQLARSGKTTAAKSKTVKKAPPKKAPARKVSATRREKKIVSSPPRVKKTQAQARAFRAQRPLGSAAAPQRHPTVDEAAALQAFDRAHREFTRGRFQEARNQFRGLLERYAQVSEVAARARTYLVIAESRLRTEHMLPRDADSLYDRGVIELNRGEYVAAQEMFERALKREPEAAHIHYGLAATRARLGSINLALQSLQRALDLQPNLRVRAQHDQDLTPLRNDPDFDRLVFAPRL
jgi:tetratricopeptide (TPR) repeat protein